MRKLRPIRARRNLGLSTVKSWISDNVMVYQARYGPSVSPAVYDSLDARMTGAPSSLMVAYEQAAYFVAIGASRAQREGETAARSVLLSALDRIESEATTAAQRASLVCTTTGFLCPQGGTTAALDSAAEVIESSGLNLDDRVRLVGYLRSNRFWFQVRRAAPLVVAGTATGLAGLWWWSRRRR